MDRTISIEKYKEYRGTPYLDMNGSATSGTLFVECEHCTDFKTDVASCKSTETLDYIIEDHINFCKKNLVFDIERMRFNVWQIKGEIIDNRGKIIIECVASREAFMEFFESLYGKDTPEGAYFKIGSWKVKLEKSDASVP